MLDKSQIDKIRDNISKVIIGMEEVVDLLLAALLAEGHVLIDDVPGMGKTKLANTLAKSLGVDFKRVQFTPDLQPADITGIYYYNQKKEDFVFRPGPVLTNILLADEINRAVPRTQSSLLEALLLATDFSPLWRDCFPTSLDDFDYRFFRVAGRLVRNA